MAISTIAIPGTSAAPTLTRASARIRSSPRPGAAISAVNGTIDRAAAIVWLTPSMIVFSASGRRTLRSVCQRVAPSDSDASTVTPETRSMASAVILMAGGIA